MKTVASLFLMLCLAGEDRAAGDAFPGRGADLRAGEILERTAPDTSGSLAEALRELAEQAEALQRGLREWPRSAEARRLAEEWRRLLEEIARAESETEESLREEILPWLQEELKALTKRFEALKPKRRRDRPKAI